MVYLYKNSILIGRLSYEVAYCLIVSNNWTILNSRTNSIGVNEIYVCE
jgi:hypothetical protein